MKNRSGINFTTQVSFTAKPVTDFQTLHCHKINTTIASNMKSHSQTKVWVLTLNLASKISYERFTKNNEKKKRLILHYTG